MLITIITPTLNAGSTIRESLESIKPQLGREMEHLLLDAGSRDQTLDVAKEYSHLKIKSEPDRGIYDGMNKGAEIARGEWLLFLQGDDWLPEGTIKAYCRAIDFYNDAEIICGDCEAVKESYGSWLPVWSVANPSSKKLIVKNIALGEPMINARLIRRDVFLKLGGFSLMYSLASDRDFLLRAAEAKIRQREIRSSTYRYRWHEGSSTMTEGNVLSKKLRQENIKIARDHIQRASRNDAATFKKWVVQLSVAEGMNAIETGDWKAFFEALLCGCCEKTYWPFYLAVEILKSFPGFVMRGGKTRTQTWKKIN